MNKQLEILAHFAPGYQPQVDCNGWRVAILNTTEKYRRANLAYFDRHLQTDEVFILLSGRCQLLLAGQGDRPQDTMGIWMESGLLYNVKQGTWHTQAMEADTRLAIIENMDTSASNSPQYFLTPDEKEALIPKA